MPYNKPLHDGFSSNNDREVLQRIEHFYATSLTLNQEFQAQATIDTEYEVGNQSYWNNIYGSIPSYRSSSRRNLYFNRIRPIVNMISGHQRKNRKSTIVIPIEDGDQATADQFTKLMMWASKKEGMLQTISESFHGALVTGMNLLQVWMDYRNDPVSGDPRIDNCSYNSFIIDPYFRKLDLSDCKGILKRTYLRKQDILQLVPDKEEAIMKLSSGKGRDQKFLHLPESYNFQNNNLIAYDEFYYKDTRMQKVLYDPDRGDFIEWTGNKDDLEDFLRANPTIEEYDQEIPTVRMSIVAGDTVLYDGLNPMGIDCYNFVPVVGYFNPHVASYSWRVQGVVRGLRSAQFLYNHRRIIELDIMESQVTSGYKYKENALVNPKDIFLTGQGRGIALKKDAQMTDVEQIVPPGIQPTMLQLSQMLSQDFNLLSGVNEELLGSADDDKAGILSMLRQGSALTTLNILFDNLDRSQQILGNILLKVIQNNFVPSKVERIINERPTDEFYNKNFGTYDSVVEEGINTSTQRQLQFAQLLHLRNSGVPIPDESIIESMTVQDKDKIIEFMQSKRQQDEQLQQQQSQLQQQQLQAEVNLLNANATANQGLGIERMSRVRENQAQAIERQANVIEKQASAEEKQASAQEKYMKVEMERLKSVIDMMKSIKELHGMNIEQVKSYLNVIDKLNELAPSGIGVERQPQSIMPEQQMFDPLAQQIELQEQIQPEQVPGRENNLQDLLGGL